MMKSYRCSSKNNNILMSCYRFEGNLRIYTDVLKNLVDIRDGKMLLYTETEYTSIRIGELIA